MAKVQRRADRDGWRMRIIEHGGQAIDLSRSDTGLITFRIGPRSLEDRGVSMTLGASEARALAYSLMAAAERVGEDVLDAPADWPEEYYAEGTGPTSRFQQQYSEANRTLPRSLTRRLAT